MEWSGFCTARVRMRRNRGLVPRVGCLERRELLSASSAAKAHAARAAVSRQAITSGALIAPGVHGYDPMNSTDPSAPPLPEQVLTTQDVSKLLQRAAAAAGVNNAIIAVVDRNGTILGVRVESGVSTDITGNTVNKVFAIDGAVALARTGAYFGNDQAPLTSRTIQEISQTTVTQREVQSNPDVPSESGKSTLFGPGFVAPVGIKGHFPPGIMFTPQVDLYGIESTNRDSISPITGTRFNVPAQYIPPGGNLVAPESYGQATGILPTAQPRGIGTLPGGVPLYKKQPDGSFAEVGGIGVFFPGTTGFATEENSPLNTPLVTNHRKPDYAQIGEYMAFVAAGGSAKAGLPFNGPVNGAPALPNFTEPFGRIDLAGITLNVFGPGGLEGFNHLLTFGAKLGAGNPNDGTNVPVDAPTPGHPVPDTLLAGQGVPFGWLVTPHDGTGITAADVKAIVARGIAAAKSIRAQIRTPLNVQAKMVFAVSDENGNILGLYRMPDATYFSIGVAVAKARNVAYYDNPSQLQPIDKIKGVSAGTAFTARTFRYVSLPFFPEGIDINPPGPGSILTDGGVTKFATNKGAPLPAKDFQSIQGYNDFNPNTNFHQPITALNEGNQNGVVLFPGSAPLYKDTSGGSLRNQLVGGLGVSGDGVLQDDDVTSVASMGYGPPRTVKRADQVKVRGIRLPYFKYNRNPHRPLDGSQISLSPIKPPLPAPRK
jgi:uncharacterized protein GlcG (DUF336 family)